MHCFSVQHNAVGIGMFWSPWWKKLLLGWPVARKDNSGIISLIRYGLQNLEHFSSSSLLSFALFCSLILSFAHSSALWRAPLKHTLPQTSTSITTAIKMLTISWSLVRMFWKCLPAETKATCIKKLISKSLFLQQTDWGRTASQCGFSRETFEHSP